MINYKLELINFFENENNNLRPTTNIEQFFLTTWGKPAFSLNTENSDASFRIQLWFYPPPSNHSTDNNAVCTLGLSQRYFDGPCPLIELSFQVPGQYVNQQLEKLGIILGELLFNTLTITQFTPNLLLTNLKYQFMPDMRDMMVIEGAGIRPLWIEMEERAIRILHLVPVYVEEVPLIREMGFWNTYRTFVDKKINFLQPHRPKIVEAMFHPEEQKLAREVDIYNGLPLNEKIWTSIQKWYFTNASNIPAANIENQPLPSDDWEYILGLSKVFTDKTPVEKTDRWLEHFWMRLYGGGFLPTRRKSLPVNPNFIT